MKTQPSPHGKAAAIGFALLAAALYAVNIPLSKLLLARVAPVMMAALLYLARALAWPDCPGCVRKSSRP